MYQQAINTRLYSTVISQFLFSFHCFHFVRPNPMCPKSKYLPNQPKIPPVDNLRTAEVHLETSKTSKMKFVCKNSLRLSEDLYFPKPFIAKSDWMAHLLVKSERIVHLFA